MVKTSKSDRSFNSLTASNGDVVESAVRKRIGRKREPRGGGGSGGGRATRPLQNTRFPVQRNVAPLDLGQLKPTCACIDFEPTAVCNPGDPCSIWLANRMLGLFRSVMRARQMAFVDDAATLAGRSAPTDTQTPLLQLATASLTINGPTTHTHRSVGGTTAQPKRPAVRA